MIIAHAKMLPNSLNGSLFSNIFIKKNNFSQIQFSQTYVFHCEIHTQL